MYRRHTCVLCCIGFIVLIKKLVDRKQHSAQGMHDMSGLRRRHTGRIAVEPDDIVQNRHIDNTRKQCSTETVFKQVFVFWTRMHAIDFDSLLGIPGTVGCCPAKTK